MNETIPTADRVEVLCEHVRQLAAAAADDALAAAHKQADTLLAAATAQAEYEYQTQLSRANLQLEKRLNRESQNARLAARGRLDGCHWELGTRVLDEAERTIERLRIEDPERYYSALIRFVQAACEALNGKTIVVRANAADVEPLRDRMRSLDDLVEITAGDVGAGVIVSTENGNQVIDHSIARRRQRMESQLRLADGKVRPVTDIYWRNTLDFSGNLLDVRGVHGVGFDEQAEILLDDGSRRWGQTLAVSTAAAVVQVFEGTKGLTRERTAIRFLGHVPELVVSEALLGRILDGLGQPRDDRPPLPGHETYPIRGLPINPVARQYPRDFIQTGVSSIDVLNSLVRGQKLPIFSGSGLPHNLLLAQILRQATLRDADSPFAVVFVAMGISHSDARFFQDVFQEEGVLERVVMFLNLANDPPMARLAAPRAGLTAAEFLAFERGYHVLVILTDMTNYADALREISTARDEVPARKGYPGYLYSDLAEIYERAGRIHGRAGSITLMPLVTLHNDDITHPVPDLTGYITEGQLMLSRDMHGHGIQPPMDVLPSLSRLMKDGIGPDRTREDHAGLASQLYAAYSEGRRVRDLAAVIGEADLSDLDRLYLKFAEAFERRFIAQGFDEQRSLFESLDLGWKLLGILPAEELTRVKVEFVRKYYSRQGLP